MKDKTNDEIISIHAPVKGATEPRGCRDGKSKYFNPRSREGSDQQLHHQESDRHAISIHAPVKGATG